MILENNIISTKLNPPAHTGSVISRPQLSTMLEQPPECPVTLICAPAGYGKSTLMAEWYKNLTGRHAIACWLSLEKDECSGIALLSYLLSSLTHVDAIPGVDTRGQLANWNEQRSTAVVTALLKEIADRQEAIVLFLDDYHTVDTQPIAHIMESLIHLMPPNLSLVIASRKRPQFPIGSLKVQNRLQEINADQLRFSEQDAAQFINAQLDQPLDADAVHNITLRTEGWPAAIQLVTLALMGTPNRQEVLNKISGNLVDVADYLAKDVLGRLPAEMQQFLLHTAVLNRLHPELCDAINPGQNNRQLIEQCLQQNLFLVPLGQTGGWYRYHYLFRDFLLNQLAINYPKKLPELHRLAARWLAERRLIAEAVAHAIEAQDYPFLTELVEQHARQFLNRGHMPQLLDWTKRIPEHLITDRPEIPILKCYALFHMRRPVEAAAALREAEQQLEALAAKGKPVALLQEELSVLRAGTAVSADDVATAKAYALQPLSDGIDAFIKGAQQNILGYCYYAEGEYQLAREALALGYTYHSQSQSTYGVVYSHSFSALVEMARGDLSRAEQLLSLAEKTAEVEESWRSYVSAEPSLYRGCVLYEWNDIDHAQELLEQNLPFVEECSQASAPVLGHIVTARILYRKHNSADAYQHLERALSICQSANLKYLRLLVTNEQTRLLIADGQIYRALAAANLLGIQPYTDTTDNIPEQWDRDNAWRLLIKVRLLLGLGEFEAAQQLAEELLALVNRTETLRPRIVLYLMKAQALYRQGQQPQALEAVVPAVTLARKGPFLSLFVEEAPFLPELLAASPKQQSWDDENQTFLDALYKPARRRTASMVSSASSSGTISADNPESEKLSSREAEIILLISQGRTNHQIADQLFIAENTVKWHLKNIFDKLGVSNRTSAVFMAKELGII